MENNEKSMILPIEGKWFRMILSGEKKEEYRIMKEYWEKRFHNYFGRHKTTNNGESKQEWNHDIKKIIFRNGYGNDKPQFTARCSLSEGHGKPEWGADPEEAYYVLTIHEIVETKNI